MSEIDVQMIKAFNDAIAKSRIQIEIYRNDYRDEWKVKVDTSNHDAEIRADAIDEFIDKFIKRNQFKQMNKCECINAMYVLAEQLKDKSK